MTRWHARFRGLQALEPRWLLAGDSLAREIAEDGLVSSASEANDIDVGLQAGNSWITAHPLGVITTPVVREGHVSPLDRLEYYEFQVNGPAELNVVLFGANAEVGLGLYDTAGTLLDFSNQADSVDETIQTVLDTGSYYLMVVNSSDDLSPYQLAMTASGQNNSVQVTNGQDLGGDSFGRATQVGPLQGSLSYWDRVGGSDPADVFRIALTQTQSVTFQLDQLTADVDLYVFTTDGQVVQNSRSPGISDESLDLSMPVGEYFVLVFPAAAAVSDYRLQINTSPTISALVPPAALDGGDTFSRATDLGVLQQTLHRSETIGGSDTTDVFRFALPSQQRVHLELR